MPAATSTKAATWSEQSQNKAMVAAAQASPQANAVTEAIRSSSDVAAEVAPVAAAAVERGAMEQARKTGLVFEIGFTFTFLHYRAIFVALMRCTFQAFRPLLILFVFGQIFKAVFFMAGAPIWCSFYSIWLFEVGYGLAQCIISFIFISFFYNNLSFARLRPSLTRYMKALCN